MTESQDPTVKVARDLTEIALLTGWLEDQALHRSADRLMPGGESMAAIGPMSPLSRWDAVEFIEQWNAGHYREPSAVDLSHLNDEPEDPDLLTSILFWSEDWRGRTGSKMPDHPTIGGEAMWLGSALRWAYENEAHWDDFARDVNRVRVNLENLLHRGERDSRTRVPCVDCGKLIIRVYRDHAVEDYYKCPRSACHKTYTQKQFDDAKARHFRSQGADKFVKLQDARDVVTDKSRPDGHRPLRTFNKWIQDGEVETMRDPRTGQRFVWWPDVRRLDLATPRRKRAET